MTKYKNNDTYLFKFFLAIAMVKTFSVSKMVYKSNTDRFVSFDHF